MVTKNKPKFLYLQKDAHWFLREQSNALTIKTGKYVSQSKVADKIFSNLKKKPSLLKAILS